jgi:hypothetical protein
LSYTQKVPLLKNETLDWRAIDAMAEVTIQGQLMQYRLDLVTPLSKS